MGDARAARLAAVDGVCAARALDGLLVSSLPNIRYLTGFTGSNALLVLGAGRRLLLTDFRYKAQAADECQGLVDVQVETSSLWSGVWRALEGIPPSSEFGFESAHLVHRDSERFQGRGRWRGVTDVVEPLRERKDADEIACIARAAEIGATALARTLSAVRAGMTELEVCGELERELRRAGSEAHPFPPIVASGPRTALPHARASSRPIAPGDLLLLDFGATFAGYCSDITRTVVVGRAGERERRVYAAVLEANARARAEIRSGMTGSAADALARAVLERHGWGDEFGHGLGHGIGLEVHEAPRLSRVAEASLPQDAVVTIEPGAYFPGWGGVRIEDDVHLSTSGPVLLTPIARELVEVT